MNLSKLLEKNEENDFITFPKAFTNYAWYKPIIVFILTTVIMFILGGLITLFASQFWCGV